MQEVMRIDHTYYGIKKIKNKKRPYLLWNKNFKEFQYSYL